MAFSFGFSILLPSTVNLLFKGSAPCAMYESTVRERKPFMHVVIATQGSTLIDRFTLSSILSFYFRFINFGLVSASLQSLCSQVSLIFYLYVIGQVLFHRAYFGHGHFLLVCHKREQRSFIIEGSCLVSFHLIASGLAESKKLSATRSEG